MLPVDGGSRRGLRICLQLRTLQGCDCPASPSNNHKRPDHRHQQCAHHSAPGVRTQITTGHLKPGDCLPSEPKLAAHHTVSTPTIRQALALLQPEGLIEKPTARATASAPLHRLTRAGEKLRGLLTTDLTRTLHAVLRVATSRGARLMATHGNDRC
ncbi:winged helix-turn-helix domain-containing protein [Streptomyces sp. NRRL F-5727]|uniref:winged helix-turn-helix domain-containing protein n=1 Tax=Streptomyces sp. NRRL F-5727 TaxID=1463871 RepID=UPI002D219E49|nr:winged helix-turn-helix domain-containing protein [Streptomyces sp. NRRL F-5727]